MTERYFYNGPRKGDRVALVGGPYATLEEAIAAKGADAMFADDHWPAQGTWFDPWLAVALPRNDYRTARQALAGGTGPVACVAVPNDALVKAL